MEVTALVVATDLSPADAERLSTSGIEVRPVKPSLDELAAAALELRRQHPRLTLVVAGPRRLVSQLEQRYPPLVDVPVFDVSAGAILAALEKDGNFKGKMG